MIFSVFQKNRVFCYSWSTLVWHRCYYLHRWRDALSPVCGIFFFFFMLHTYLCTLRKSPNIFCFLSHPNISHVFKVIRPCRSPDICQMWSTCLFLFYLVTISNVFYKIFFIPYSTTISTFQIFSPKVVNISAKFGYSHFKLNVQIRNYFQNIIFTVCQGRVKKKPGKLSTFSSVQNLGMIFF